MGHWWSKTPEPGDLIEIDRGLYQHWAVYVGDDWVVHLTSPPGAKVLGIISDSMSVQGAVSDSLMSVPTEEAMVRKEKLQKVVGDSKWTINNSLDKTYESRSPCIIVEEALMQVGNVMEYSVITKNCEHFVNKLRYGKAVSLQVLKAAVAIVDTLVGAVQDSSEVDRQTGIFLWLSAFLVFSSLTLLLYCVLGQCGTSGYFHNSITEALMSQWMKG